MASTSNNNNSNNNQEIEKFGKHVFVGLRYPETLQHTVSNDHESVWDKLKFSDRNSISNVNRMYGSNAKKIILLPNDSKTKIGGHVFAVSSNAELAARSAVDDEEPFGYIMLTRIRDDSNLSDKYFDNTIHEKLNRKLSQLQNNDDHVSINTHFNNDEPSIDKLNWTPKLYGDDSKVGIYSLRDSNGGKNYYILAMSSAGPKIGNELISNIENNRLTANKYTKDTKTIWAKKFGERNCRRLLYEASKAIGLNIPSVEDSNAFVPKYHVRPKLGKPDVITTYNTFNKGVLPDCNQRIVQFYRDCADGNQGKISTLIVGDPISDVYEYQGLDVDHQNQTINNNLLNVLPCFTSNTFLPKSKKQVSQSVVESIQSKIKLLDGSSPLESHYLIRKPHDQETMRKQSSIYNIGNHPALVRNYSPVIVSMNKIQ